MHASGDVVKAEIGVGLKEAGDGMGRLFQKQFVAISLVREWMLYIGFTGNNSYETDRGDTLRYTFNRVASGN